MKASNGDRLESRRRMAERTFDLTPELDEANVRILEELERQPRLSMSELGRRIGMSAPAVTERVQRMEDAGVIAGYRLEVDPRALGRTITAYVRVRPTAGQLRRIAELARRTPAVVECHRITGDDCFIMRMHVRDLADLEKVLDEFIPYGQTNTAIVQSSPVPARELPLREP
jgi:Lrp/AsnC family transcriptional regulator, leucine-responsive regulatory protein